MSANHVSSSSPVGGVAGVDVDADVGAHPIAARAGTAPDDSGARGERERERNGEAWWSRSLKSSRVGEWSGGVRQQPIKTRICSTFQLAGRRIQTGNTSARTGVARRLAAGLVTSRRRAAHFHACHGCERSVRARTTVRSRERRANVTT